ncbi:death domain-associated protein 6 isoform X2 [Agrilus planipennis]|uniref:Death domain-associated protein 6 isoform X2 n=1 Tax=Agrilus planipennis TaxID=224129 RepID=A0A7F5R5Y7_AGRPL|nr:death domain-associated protein 6 isoform X2 [Agrilus planipennis]
MEEVISISSDEEDFEPTSKKAKLGKDVDDCIVISVNEGRSITSDSTKQIKEESITMASVDSLEPLNEEEFSKEVKSQNLAINNTKQIKAESITMANVDSLEPLNEEEFSKEVKSQNLAINSTNMANGESSNNSSNFQRCLSEFLELCVTIETNEAYKNVILQKIPLLKEVAASIECKYSESDLIDLIAAIKLNKKQAKENPSMILVYYDKIYRELKSAYYTKNYDTNPKKEKNIRALEKAIYNLRKKISALEEAEVDFDEDENSSYIKMQRYRERAAQLYKRYCGYINENPYKGRPSYSRLDISCSKFPEINRAIDKHFRNKDLFPTYYDMEKLIKKCIERHKLELSKTELNEEVKTCFKKLGELLQARRKRDLGSVHCSYLENLMDPAKDDPDLDKKLKENGEAGEKRINQICEKYVQLQEKNTELNKTDESNSESSSTEEIVD